MTSGLTVEEVFVVYEDGCLIAHKSIAEDVAMDLDIVTGMLTAIRNFLGDVFGGGEEWGLRKLEFRDKTILIEGGAHIYIAVVYTGSATEKLLEEIKRTIAVIEERYEASVGKWNGDLSAWKGIRNLIECLLSVEKSGRLIEDRIVRKRFCPLCAMPLADASSLCERCGFDFNLLDKPPAETIEISERNGEGSSILPTEPSSSHFKRLMGIGASVKPLPAYDDDGNITELFEKGCSYLILDRRPDPSFKIFNALVSSGFNGICVTKTDPLRVTTFYGVENARVLWVGKEKARGCLGPKDLDIILQEVAYAGENSLILLEAMDFLIESSDFLRLLKFTYELMDMLDPTSILIIPVNHERLDENQLALLGRNMRIFFKEGAGRGTDLSGQYNA